jgi:hypothetical protein
MIVDQITLSVPIAAFNGGMLVDPGTMKFAVPQRARGSSGAGRFGRCRDKEPLETKGVSVRLAPSGGMVWFLRP